MQDIQDLNDIKSLVDSFYSKIQHDDLLGPIFNGVIKDNWPAHLEKMYRFWQTILLDEVAYSGSPFLAHAPLPIHKPHFERWMGLWKATVDGMFMGEKATESIWRAERMAEMFLYKLDHMRANNTTPLI
ncbi:MAG: group III truncated hemoglobin [Chitinophagaceae bacterium]|nr:MAG: group III truncated hemoglobin [Chitinophagaceae bacterium]